MSRDSSLKTRSAKVLRRPNLLFLAQQLDSLDKREKALREEREGIAERLENLSRREKELNDQISKQARELKPKMIVSKASDEFLLIANSSAEQPATSASFMRNASLPSSTIFHM